MSYTPIDHIRERPDEIARSVDKDFANNIENLIRDAEDTRLSYMKKHRFRSNMAMIFGMGGLFIAAAGFGWFLLVKTNIIMAVLCVIIASVIPAFLYFWSARVLKDYQVDHKRTFLPRLAKALGGFKFHPNRGISSKVINKTGIVPKHDIYKAEDCFMGKYKGVKVLFSEARLLSKKKPHEPIFDGIFVLLEIPDSVIEGHIVMSADRAAVQRWRGTRWRKLKSVVLQTDNPDWKRFAAFSDYPDSASLLIGERLLKELTEASAIFDEAALSVSFFNERFIFMMIPNSHDMFEASDMHMPVATKQHALQCKREVEQILEIIDVFELYKPAKMAGDEVDSDDEAEGEGDEDAPVEDDASHDHVTKLSVEIKKDDVTVVKKDIDIGDDDGDVDGLDDDDEKKPKKK